MAADKIDMSLEDIIKMDKISGVKKGSGGAGRRAGNIGSGSGNNNNNNNNNNNRGAIRNKVNRNANRSAPYSKIPDKWQHDMFDGPARGGSNHLLVSNLDYGVSNKDIQDLFVEFGALKKAAVHYDRSGRSLGTADVIFANRGDAAAAMKQYNGVLLDGRPMKITIVTSSGDNQRRSAPVSGTVNRSQKFGNTSRGGGTGQRSNQQQQQQQRNNQRGRGGNMSNNMNRGPRRNQNANRKPVTAEELDADLDAYVNK